MTGSGVATGVKLKGNPHHFASPLTFPKDGSRDIFKTDEKPASRYRCVSSLILGDAF